MMLRVKLKEIVEKDSNPSGRIFDLVVQIIILLAILAFSIETIPDLDPQLVRFLKWAETCFLVAFTAEYLFRLYVADRARDYAFSFFGIIDFLAIAPFFLTGFFDLRSLKVIRIVRVFGLLKLFRYSKAMRRMKLAIMLIREELLLVLFLSGIVMYIAAVGIYFFEREAQPEAFASVFHSMWWAVVTLTTVGYGDVYPVTIGGRVFTFLILMIGLGFVAIPSGMFASAMNEAKDLVDQENDGVALE